MSKIIQNKQKVEAELELVKANLEALKAKAKSATVDMQIKIPDNISEIKKDLK